MEGPLLLHHRKPTPSQTTAVSRQCDADGGSYGWPLGPQARSTAWSANSLARSATPRSRSQSVPNTHHGTTASRFRPLNTDGVMWESSSAFEGGVPSRGTRRGGVVSLHHCPSRSSLPAPKAFIFSRLFFESR